MDKTKAKLAAFFDNDDNDESSSFPQKAVDDRKLYHYTQGTVRKSKREREKEAADAKLREEEANTSRVYEEFMDEFQGSGPSRKTAGAFVRAGETKPILYASSGPRHSEQSSKPFEDDLETEAPATRPRGKRAMDAFLEEIKSNQAEREARFSKGGHGRSATAMAAYEGQSGSHDRGDPETTNVFVSNLPPNVTEQSFGLFFARCGPVGSVKIMWPRGDGSQGPGSDMTNSRRSRNVHLSGFVSFMKRKGAEAAVRDLDGFDWGGSILRVGWSKAVPIATRPAFSLRRSRSRSPADERFETSHRTRSPGPARQRSRSQTRSRHHQTSRYSRSRERDRSRSYSPPRNQRPYSPDTRYGRLRSRSRSPRRRSRSRAQDKDESEEQRTMEDFVRIVAGLVRRQTADYEVALREREHANAKYAFLVHGHRMYKLYDSLAHDSRAPTPEFDEEGYNSVYSSDSAEDSERERVRRTQLGRLARRRFVAMLRAISGRRGELARCMAFSLEHAEAASEVTDIIVASLLVDATPVPRKVARLHLICDILHNSAASVPSAWKFRQEFQWRLGLVFDHLSSIYHSFPGRITAETFKKQISAVVDVWEDWIVFPPDFTAELRARLDGVLDIERALDRSVANDFPPISTGGSEPSKFHSTSFKPALPDTHMESTNVDVIDDDVDGEAMDGESLDGEPMDGGSIDGEQLKESHRDNLASHEDEVEDVDGEPMETEDIDGDT